MFHAQCLHCGYAMNTHYSIAVVNKRCGGSVGSIMRRLFVKGSSYACVTYVSVCLRGFVWKCKM
jgi:hypothetical protein